MNLASERIGVEFTTKYGEQVIVIDYVNCDKVQVMFLGEHKLKTWTSWDKLKNKCGLTNPFTKTVNGVGYLGIMSNGEKPKVVDETGKATREYKVWTGMIARCYDDRERHKTYKNVTVCDRWHSFALFLEDIDKIREYQLWKDNPRQGIALNKDMYYADLGIITDEKVYSLETCRFITKSENMKEVTERTEPHRAKKVKATHVETGHILEFESITQASKIIQSKGTERTREKKIGDCLNGRQKSAYGYLWEYVD